MLHAQLEAAEAAHYLAAALIVPYMVYAWVQNWWDVVFWFMVLHLLGNAYPIFHLRWVRGRLERVSQRRTRLSGRACPGGQSGRAGSVASILRERVRGASGARPRGRAGELLSSGLIAVATTCRMPPAIPAHKIRLSGAPSPRMAAPRFDTERVQVLVLRVANAGEQNTR